VPQSRSGQVRNISPPPGFDPRTVQPVASRHTDYATRPTVMLDEVYKLWRSLLCSFFLSCYVWVFPSRVSVSVLYLRRGNQILLSYQSRSYSFVDFCLYTFWRNYEINLNFRSKHFIFISTSICPGER